MTTLQVAAQKRLREHIEAIERLQQQQRDLAEDIRERFADAKGEGFDVKIMRKLIGIRRKSKAEYEQEEAILASYMGALGLANTPMGDYIIQQRRLEAVE